MKAKIYFTAIVMSFLFVQGSFGQGCMDVDSEDGVSVIGYIQPTYDNYFFEEDQNGNTLNKPNSFYFHRARLGVAGSIPYDISYYFIGEFSPLLNGNAYILDAFITYSPFKNYLKFSVGQFKSPVSLELAQPCHNLHTIRRSIVVNSLAFPLRDMGLMLMGSTDSLFGKKDLISYSFAILNGSGLNTWDNNKYKDIAGRIVIRPWDWLALGGSYRYGKQEIKKTDKVQPSRERYGFDLEVEYKNFKVQGEYLAGTDIGEVSTSGGGGCGGKSVADDDPEFNRDGFYVMAMYMTPWHLQPIIKYETFDPDQVDYTYLGASQDFPQDAITFGLNYWFNEWTRLSVNYLYNAEPDNEYKNDAISIQWTAQF
jgi:phosphate-selective porin